MFNNNRYGMSNNDSFSDIASSFLKSLADASLENINRYDVERKSNMKEPHHKIDISTFGAYDVYTNDNTIKVLIDLPGVLKQDIKMILIKESASVYTLKVDVKRTLEQSYRSKSTLNRFNGELSISVPLPYGQLIETSGNITATQMNGVVLIELQRKVEKEGKIAIPIVFNKW